MSYEESKLFSLLKKQDIDSLFLEATNYLCQTKSLFEEKEQLQQENEQLKEQLLVAQTNEETFKLEMEDITKILGLDENTLFDDVKVYARSLKDNWKKLKEIAKSQSGFKKRANLKGGVWFEIDELLDKMKELEQGSDSNEI
jgi:hypothetical protein